MFTPEDDIETVNAVKDFEAKRTAILDANIPSWSQVETAIDAIDSWAKLRVVLKKMARAVYWLARSKEA